MSLDIVLLEFTSTFMSETMTPQITTTFNAYLLSGREFVRVLILIYETHNMYVHSHRRMHIICSAVHFRLLSSVQATFIALYLL